MPIGIINKEKSIQKEKERLFLTENLLNENNKGERKFLLEIDGGDAALQKAMTDPNQPIYLNGIIQKGDTPNRNGRIYPFSILKKECDRYMNEEVRDGQSFGELDHPAESTVPELKNSAMTIEDVWYKGLEVWGRVKLLNAFAGPDDPANKARSIVLNKKTLGISSRALGSVYQDQSGYDVVEDDLEIICWDLVSRPSTYDANLRLAESKQSKKVAMLTESQCLGGNCNLKTSKQIIKEKKISMLTESEKVYLDILGVEKFLQIKNTLNG